jgi:hypothetical protein
VLSNAFGVVGCLSVSPVTYALPFAVTAMALLVELSPSTVE